MLNLLEGCDSQGQIVLLVGLIFFMMMMKPFSLVEENTMNAKSIVRMRFACSDCTLVRANLLHDADKTILVG